MSSDPNYVVVNRWNYEEKLPEGMPELDYVVVPPVPASSSVDLSIHLAAEIIGSYMSAINSGRLDATQILSAVYLAKGYMDPLLDVTLQDILDNRKPGEGMFVLGAEPDEVGDEWRARQVDRFNAIMRKVKRDHARKHAEEGDL